MQYIDTSSRDSAHALGTWLASLSPHDITSFRFQSGYFGAEGLGPLAGLFPFLRDHDLPTACVLGSNGGETDPRDVDLLLDLAGCPRTHARIAIVAYTTGLYHPKVYHATRADGSQAAYVGSANLTFPGISGVNIEAGLVLDTADGDPEPTLAEIASAVDTWFNGTRDGVHVVGTHDDVAELVAAGVLGLPRPTRPRRAASSTSVPEREPVRLDPLVRFPSLRPGGDGADGDSDSSAGVGTIAAPTDVIPPEPRLSVPYPDVAPPYVLFAPDATDPTHGVEALTGSTLPGGAIGLIIRLNRDSSRHFEDRRGTANVSVPVPAIAPLRFGFYAGRYRRPRCEFTLRMRYVDDAGGHCEQVAATNVMVYGHAPGETGNSDVRFVLPRPAVRVIQDFVQGRGSRLPADGHPMVLEWPTLSDPSFQASFADPDSQLFAILRDALDSAAERGELVGRGACWLLPDLVTIPDWQSE